MNFTNSVNSEIDAAKLFSWMKHLFPLNRSLMGDDFRYTLTYLFDRLPNTRYHKFKSGTRIYDWTIPLEWNITEAWIKDIQGNTVVDFNDCNLHVVGYSVPVPKQIIDFDVLKKHIHTLEDQPTAIPYVTSYYQKDWGFCMEHNRFIEMSDKKYVVNINSTFNNGNLVIGDAVFRGESEKEIIFTSYCCHPSMANNELSGPILLTALADWLGLQRGLKYTYRFVLGPETIGSLSYLSRFESRLKENVLAGYNLTCLGDKHQFSYVQTRYGNTYAEKILEAVLQEFTDLYDRYQWLDRGSEERQYASPAFNMPFCSICRSKFGTFPEYHTSLDDLSFVSPEHLYESFELLQKLVIVIENNSIPFTNTKGEPFLTRYGLCNTLSKKSDFQSKMNLLNFVSYSDGGNDVIDIAQLMSVPLVDAIALKDKLLTHGLIYEKHH